MHIQFDSLHELMQFMEFAGFERTVDKVEGTKLLDRVHIGAVIAASTVTPDAATETGTPRRGRRTKAEIEADKQRAAEALAAPLADTGVTDGDVTAEDVIAVGLGDGAREAIADALNAPEKQTLDSAAYVEQHGARLGAEVSSKDFLVRCQNFIKAHGLSLYSDMLTASGVAMTAIASCTQAERGAILARMEWFELKN